MNSKSSSIVLSIFLNKLNSLGNGLIHIEKFSKPYEKGKNFDAGINT